MKKIYSLIAAACLGIALTACDSKLDIVPKGKTTLDNIDDLESLLNQQYSYYGCDQLESLVGITYPEKWKTPDVIMASKQSLEYAIMTGDESVDRVALATTDSKYDGFYSDINYVNVVISKAPEAVGDEKKKKEVVAEAKVKRAWFHFLAANLYARQYDEATAADLGGVAYVTNTNVQEQKTKLPLKVVYELMLEDCADAVIADMPQKAIIGPSRAGAELGNAVRALVLFQMKRYAEAIPYCEAALRLNSNLEDRSEAMQTGMWTLDYLATNNYLLIRDNNSNLGEFYGYTVTPPVASLINANDYVNLLGDTQGWGEPYGATENCRQCAAADVHYSSWGIRTENVMYTLAECLIRTGKIQEGLAKVDAVQKLRIQGYQPLADSGLNTEADAMKALQEAKTIEMLTTVYNFLDRKRWNTESAYAADVLHDYEQYGQFYLKPDSKLWVFPFPLTVTLYNDSMTQNF